MTATPGEENRRSLRQRLSQRLPPLPPLPPLPKRKNKKHVQPFNQGSLKREKQVEQNLEQKENCDPIKLQKAQYNESKRKISETMGLMVGDLIPKCARCHGTLEKGQNINICGMQKFHVVCPSKEEAAKKEQSVRNVVRALPDRPVAMITCDIGENARPYTFLFQVDKKSKKAALKQKSGQPAIVSIRPDDKASLPKTRMLSPNHSNPEFGLSFRKAGKIEAGFSARDPTGDEFVPRPNLAMCGTATLDGEKVDIGLSHDGLLLVQKLCASSRKSGAQGQVMSYALSPEHTDVMAVTHGVDLHGVISCDSDSDGETITLQLRTEFIFQAMAWRNALYNVLINLGQGSNISMHSNRVTVRSYRLIGNVLEQAVVRVLYNQKDLSLELEGEAHMIYTQFPETSDAQPEGDSYRAIQSSITRAKEARRKRLESESKSEE